MVRVQKSHRHIEDDPEVTLLAWRLGLGHALILHDPHIPRRDHLNQRRKTNHLCKAAYLKHQLTQAKRLRVS